MPALAGNAEQFIGGDVERLRRDYVRYLALIDAIAFYQQQRACAVEMEVAAEEYVEVAESEIALANRPAHAVHGRGLDGARADMLRNAARLDFLSAGVTD